MCASIAERFFVHKALGTKYFERLFLSFNKLQQALLEQLNKLYDEIKTSDADRIYSMDETGIFFRMIPNYTYILPNEDVKITRGRKKHYSGPRATSYEFIVFSTLLWC